MLNNLKPIGWVLLAIAVASGLIVLAASVAPKNEVFESCKAENGVTVKSAFTNEVFCIDKSFVKSIKRI